MARRAPPRMREAPLAWAGDSMAFPLTTTTIIRIYREVYRGHELVRLGIYRALDPSAGQTADRPWEVDELRPCGACSMGRAQALDVVAALVAMAEGLRDG